MATANLTAERRTDTGKGVARKLRASERTPAVIYGHNREPESLVVPSRDLERLLDQISVETTVIELSVDGTSTRTLIREVQRHPLKRQILHVDFQELIAGEEMTVNIPLVIVGIAPGVRNDGGMLDQVMRELTVSVDPANMPNHLDIDVSKLEIGDSIHVRDLAVPAGVVVLQEEDAVVAHISMPRAVEEEVVEPVEGEEGEVPAEGAEAAPTAEEGQE